MMPSAALPPLHRHRALFLSDLHLGALGGRADLVLAFLERHTAETIYLVGDVLDLWHPLVTRWTPTHERVLDLLRRRASEGVRLVYLLGNHDDAMRDPALAQRLPGECLEQAEHEAADGRRHLVLHGHVCDGTWLRGHVMTRIGSTLDAVLRGTGEMLRALLRRPLPPEGWGLVGLTLVWVSWALNWGTSHERRLAAFAQARGFEGVICGHFHTAALHERHGVLYANCGDWVDSFTALAEGADGRFRLIDGVARRPAAPPRGAAGLAAGA